MKIEYVVGWDREAGKFRAATRGMAISAAISSAFDGGHPDQYIVALALNYRDACRLANLLTDQHPAGISQRAQA